MSNEINNAYISLAGAVIRRAIDDLELLKDKRPERRALGREAQRFLSGEGLDTWCAVLGLEASYIRARIEKLNGVSVRKLKAREKRG
jgi:hypothetical protein